MGCFLKRISAFMRRINFTYHRRYDNEGALYTPDNKEEPAFYYAVRGSYTVSLWRVLGTLFSVFSFLLALKTARAVKKARRTHRRRVRAAKRKKT